MKNMKTRIFPVLAALVIGAMAMPGTSQAAADVTAPARASACTTVIGSTGVVRGDYITGSGTYPVTTVVIRVPVCVDKKTAKITSASAPSWTFKDTAAFWRFNYATSLPRPPAAGSDYYPFFGTFNWSVTKFVPGVSLNNINMTFNVNFETRVYSSAFVQACIRIRSVGMTNVPNPRITSNQWSCVLMPR